MGLTCPPAFSPSRRGPAAGASPGLVVASPSKAHPDYFYSWSRDSALTFATIFDRFVPYANGSVYAHADLALEPLLREYVDSQAALQLVTTPSGGLLDGGLGEPKFEVNGSAFTGSWGRPQRVRLQPLAVALAHICPGSRAYDGLTSDVARAIPGRSAASGAGRHALRPVPPQARRPARRRLRPLQAVQPGQADRSEWALSAPRRHRWLGVVADRPSSVCQARSSSRTSSTAPTTGERRRSTSGASRPLFARIAALPAADPPQRIWPAGRRSTVTTSSRCSRHTARSIAARCSRSP